MFVKLAFRNVRRQLGNYLIYFITVSVTVALMFAVNNMIYSPQMLERADASRELKSGLIIITIFVSLIVAFVLGYATSFMLKLRKREFGTYLTLGMNRKNILSIFVLETMLLGIAALLAGMLLGLFLYQGLMLLLINLLDIELSVAAYSLKGFLLTILLVVCIFILSSFSSALYLKKVSVYTLLHGGEITKKRVKNPALWFVVMLLSFAAVLWSCIVFYNGTEDIMRGAGAALSKIFGSLLMLAVSIVLFHVALAKSIVHVLLKSEKLRCRGTNIFTFRQLSGKLESNALMAGALSFLIAFSIIGANCSFVQKVGEEASLGRQYPFDLVGHFDAENESPLSIEEAEKIVGQYTGIQKKIPYNLYTSGNGFLYSFTPWTGDGYEGLHDVFMKESDVNRLLVELGRDPVTLDGGYMILGNVPQILQYDFTGAVVERNGKQYHFLETSDDFPLFSYVYFIAVVPDEATEGMEVSEKYIAYDLADGKYDAIRLRESLSYSYTTETGSVRMRCDYNIKEYGRINSNNMTAIFIIGALYIAIVFIFMTMAILALKTLSGLSEDRKRYEVLYRIGTGVRERKRALFQQIFSFFVLPFAVPLLLSIPAALICAQIMRFGGFKQQIGQVFVNAGMIALVTTLIYFLYFTATYLIARKNLIGGSADSLRDTK